mmetsp:Transcript_9611/g.33800  ORF Transcript_9611/g.33800 Transcript_9611/m.33800 type:complete len:219 (-) Transcript_9611:698-1354(-)
MNTNSSSMAVTRPPRLAGERKPKTANTISVTAIMSTCTPEPTSTDSTMGPNQPLGGRKTSACTSFQPDSSCESSSVDSSLYLAMSRFSARIRIMAIMPVRKSTIMRELMMENQCTSSSCVPSRKTCHRSLHFVSLSFQITLYVKMTFCVPSMGCGAASRVASTPGLHVSSCVEPLMKDGPAYVCLMLIGSTSKPTMRTLPGSSPSSLALYMMWNVMWL